MPIEKPDWSDQIGNKLFIRTVTYHLVGEVVDVRGSVLKLKNASWVADSGRFYQAITKGTLSEVEPVGEVFINAKSITDAFPWNHDLPTNQK